MKKYPLRQGLLAWLSVLLAAPMLVRAQNEAVTPNERIDLMADPEFADFTPYLNRPRSVTMDPKEVWSIQDGLLHVSGKGWGYLRTNQRYRDYHLVLEFKWGEHTYASRADRARDCGLLVHGYGEDGAYADTWMNSIEAQLIEGGSGDILVLAYRGKDGLKAPTSLTCEVTPDRDGEPVWTPGGKTLTFPEAEKQNQRINWRDRDPDWTDVKGYRGAKDIENPVGDWNRMEVVCKGGHVQIFLNGELVNEGAKANPDEGFICLQSEAAECWIRRYELWPLGGFTETWDPEKASTDTGYSPTGDSLLPRRLPWSPEESLAAWEIDGDYELQLVATEPLVCDPVDVVWDEQGRMFVAEMRDYPLPPESGSFLSRIRLLSDQDGDGRMDQAVTWADELDHVQGLLPMNGGLLATTRTAVLFLKDTDGDNVADERRVIFGSNEPRHSQLQISCARWGLDNAIYLNNGLDGKEVYPGGEESGKLDITKTNLRYDPRADLITRVSGVGQFGATQDDWGHRFFCSNRNPTMFAVMPLEAVTRNPHAGLTTGHEDIAPEGGNAKVYPLQLSHTTADAHAGTHTAACGLGVYRGALMPDLKGNVFVCEPTGQLVTRSKLSPDGASLKAERVGDHRDFLASHDEWSRPVNVRNGPDGALYICDMYRRFIDHARFFPEEFSQSNYMRAGFDQGRIYRLAPKGYKAPPARVLPAASKELVALLESSDNWPRLTAQRLLVDRQAKEVAPQLEAMLKDATSAQTRVHAQWTLDGLGLATVEHVLTGLKDAEPGVVESAIVLAERKFPDRAEVEKAYLELTRHDSRRVRFLAAIELADDESEAATEALTAVLGDDPGDEWIRKGVLSASEKRAGTILAALLEQDDFRAHPGDGRADLVREFASAAAARADEGEMSALAFVTVTKEEGSGAWWQFAVMTGFSDGFRQSSFKSLANFLSKPPAGAAPQVLGLKAIIAEAETLATDDSKPLADRLAALPLVRQQGLERTLPIVEKLIDQKQPVEIQEAACQALARFDRNQVADFFFEHWKTLPPTPRREALALISANQTTALRLMQKMKAGEINPALMDPMSRWRYARSNDEEVKALALELFGQASSDRAEVIQDYHEALKLEGSAARGREVFTKAACITCHKVGDLGVSVGPDITDVRIKPAEALLTDILDPNRAVEERWVSYMIETSEGNTVVGLVTGETADTVVVTSPGGAVVTVPRNQVSKMEASGYSLMPVGMEAAITKQDMADLIAFLKKG